MAQSSHALAAERRPAALASFCETIGAILPGMPEAARPAAVARHLPALLADPALIGEAERAAPAGGYGRHCIFACPRELYSVLAMVWPAGIVSPVHDHLTWCALGVYEGVLEERRYAPASDAADESRAIETAVLTHRPGEVVHLPVDTPNIHRMANPTDRPTITIHVYGGDTNKLGPNLRQVWSA